MGRARITPKILELAEGRALGLKAIDNSAELNLGQGLSLAKFQEMIANTKTLTETYHLILAQSDKAKNELEASKALLNDAYAKVLIAVAAQFGKDSSEYEQVGGVRKSERKRPVRKAKADKSDKTDK